MADLATILSALFRLPVPVQRQPEFLSRIGEYIDRAAFAGLAAGVRPAPANKRGSPVEIDEAVAKIARGMELIERGLSTIDGAQRSTSRSATKRTAELARLQRAVLGHIVAAATRRLPIPEIPAVTIEAAMPSYGTHGFDRSWNGAFQVGAAHIAKVRASISREDLKAPRPRDDWFINLVDILASIYADATGAPARAYARGDAVDGDWKGSPFCRFVIEIWPAYSGENEPAPSHSKIRDARRAVTSTELPTKTDQ